MRSNLSYKLQIEEKSAYWEGIGFSFSSLRILFILFVLYVIPYLYSILSETSFEFLTFEPFVSVVDINFIASLVL